MTFLLALTCSMTAGAQPLLSLREAIQQALSSPDAQIAETRVDSSQALVRQAGLSPNPRLYLQAEDIRPWANDFSFTNQTEDYGYLGQIIETDGKRSKRIALAQANLHRNEAERSLQIQQIVGKVTVSYWSAVVGERVVELLKRDLTTVDAMVRYHQERVDAGAMKGVDLIRMQIERDRIALSLADAERDAQLARIEVFRQMGRPATPNMLLSDDIGAVVAPPALDFQSVLDRRPDLAVARDELEAAEADLKLQHALAVPDPDLLGGYKRNSGDNAIFTAIQLPLPIRSRNQGEIQRAQAQVRAARAVVERTELAVRADVEAATDSYQREREIVEHTLPELRAHAQQNLGILTEAYRIGGVDLLRYIDAERTSIDVEITALRALGDYQRSILRLQLAYGQRP